MADNEAVNISTSSRPLIPNGYAEPKEAAPRLALLDDFDGDEVGFPHGQAVESVLLSHSDLQDADVQRIQNMPEQARIEEIMRNQKVDFRRAYGAAVLRNVAKFYLSTAQNLQTVLKEQPTVQVISQSQGETSARLAGTLIEGLQASEPMRQHANQAFGLETDAPLPELLEALIAESDRLLSDNELITQARQEYLKAARQTQEQGVVYLVAAGNHGDLAHQLEQMGVKTSSSAFRNIFATEYATVVGATTAEGGVSGLNSPNSGAEVWARGENLPWQAAEGFDRQGVDSGTSFATPLVAGQILGMLDREPHLTPFDLEARLQGLDSTRLRAGESRPTTNGQVLQADGQLESYIASQIGEGFVTDIFGDTAQQLAAARQDRTFFGLPGTQDHEFQIVKVSPDPDGVRQLSVDTYFLEGHHVLRANLKHGAWDPSSVVEELHLDRARQAEIEKMNKGS